MLLLAAVISPSHSELAVKINRLFVLSICHRSAATVLTAMRKYERGRAWWEDTDDMEKVPKEWRKSTASIDYRGSTKPQQRVHIK